MLLQFSFTHTTCAGVRWCAVMTHFPHNTWMKRDITESQPVKAVSQQCHRGRRADPARARPWGSRRTSLRAWGSVGGLSGPSEGRK